MTTRWTAGTRVTIRKIKQTGVVTEELGEGRYRVAVGSLHLTCRGEELVAAEPKKKNPNDPTPYHHTLAQNRRDKVPQEVDLHGMTADEATRAVDSLIDRAVLAGTREIRIVHGLGSGRLQHAIHAYLSSCGAVKNFRISDWNPGVTVVYL